MKKVQDGIGQNKFVELNLFIPGRRAVMRILSQIQLEFGVHHVHALRINRT